MQDTDDPTYCIAFSPDGTLLADGRADRTIHFWDTKNWHQIEGLNAGRYNDILSIAFSPNGNLLASGSHDVAGLMIFPDVVTLWGVADKLEKRVFDIASDKVQLLTFNKTGTLLAALLVTKTKTSKIRVWNVNNGEETRTLSNDINARSIAFHPSQDILAIGYEGGSIAIWDLTTGSINGTYPAHQENVNTVTFNPKGDILVSGSEDGVLKFWQVLALEY